MGRRRNLTQIFTPPPSDYGHSAGEWAIIIAMATAMTVAILAIMAFAMVT